MRTAKITCMMCQKVHEIQAPEEEFQAWESGVLIQRALRSLTDDQRELLISKTCGPCFDKLFEVIEQ